MPCTPFIWNDVQVQERMEESLELLFAAMNRPLPANATGRRINATPYATPPPDVYRILERLNHLDMELYSYGVRLLEARLREARLREAR